MRAGVGINKLGIDANPIAALLLATLQNIMYPKVSSDLSYVHSLSFIGEGGAAGDDEAMGNA